MTDIKDFILQLEDTTLSLEEQQAALLMIEQTLIENKQIQEKTLEESSNLIVDAVRTVEEKLDAKFTALKTDPKLKGPKGDQGIRGENGKSGRDGVNGKDGINGHDGADGIDGKDGRYVVNVEVDLDDTLLVTLSDGTQIKTTKEIKGPKGDQGPQGLRGSPGIGLVSGGSTGQVLTKVSNSDYDTTWSTNGAGTVTSVGGTGTVNGLSLSGTVTSSGNLTLGGTLDLSAPPAIGGTTPAAGTFTTITGQTEVLKGTGSNLFIQSQTFTAVNWTKLNTTVTSSATTAPDGSSTASKFVATVTSGQHGVNQGVTLTTALCTFSFYAKAAEYTNIRIDMTDAATGDVYCDANLSAGTISAVTSGGSWTNSSATITSVGSGWYRITLTSLRGAGSSPIPVMYLLNNAGSLSFAGNGTDGVFVWGAQVELGSTANTYIPTTTTAIYGTPTLSFSGVAGLGLQSDGSLYVSPAGTGALQAQATTSTTVGGNARGANAVDWQTARATAAQVASAQWSTISGGVSNTASATASNIGGGATNAVSNTFSGIFGGQNNTNTATYSFIGGGSSNTTATNAYQNIVGGKSNTASGWFNFIGAGFTNSGTSASAVTTQSGTMNATTAVTLSGSNASIKVGQYITGTSISADTYVSAISGTSLTLSQAASGSSTSTLSFYTPHGVVVGGGNNQATGSYSFIGGGGDAGTAANRNTASGDWSFVGGGMRNTASGISSFVGGGGTTGSGVFPNSSSGSGAVIVGGFNNSSSGTGSVVGGGYSNTANQTFATIVGGSFGTSRSISGNTVFPACDGPITGNSGVTQAALLILAVETSNATPAVLTSNSIKTGNTGNQVILPNNSAYFFRGEVVSGVTGGGNTKGWTIEGVIKRGANAASTALVGTPQVVSSFADVGAATWTIGVTADTTNGGIAVTFTGQASTTIRVVAQLRTTEMTY